jgi:hypothetical protein
LNERSVNSPRDNLLGSVWHYTPARIVMRARRKLENIDTVTLLSSKID